MGRNFGVRLAGKALIVHERVSVRRVRGLVWRKVLMLLECPQLRIFLERLPLFVSHCRMDRSGIRSPGFRLLIDRLEVWIDLLGRRLLPSYLRTTPDRSECFALSALNFGGISAAATLEVEVLADRIIK
jgi:hypothetical protein